MEAEGYRYLSVHLNNRLDWKCNTESVYKLKIFKFCCNSIKMNKLKEKKNKTGECSGPKRNANKLPNIMDRTCISF